MDCDPSTCVMFVYKPCNHLFLFIGRVSAASQNLCRRRQEVKAVVFEILIDQRHQDLRGIKATISQVIRTNVGAHLKSGPVTIPWQRI